MKRSHDNVPPPPLPTLFDAAFVHNYGTLSKWVMANSLKLTYYVHPRVNTVTATQVQNIKEKEDHHEQPSIPSKKKKKIKPKKMTQCTTARKSEKKIMSTYMIGIKPTKEQKQRLLDVITAENIRYNWCIDLYKEAKDRFIQLKNKYELCKKILETSNEQDQTMKKECEQAELEKV